jgi:hypothetical protein
MAIVIRGSRGGMWDERPGHPPPSAVRLAVRGLAVFALPPGGRVPGPGWQAAATSDPLALGRSWRDGDNVGIACRPSRILVLDLDVRPADYPGGPDGVDGVSAWRRLCADHDQDPFATFTVATPSGGRHVYWRVGPDCTIGSYSGPRSPLGVGIDVRGPGRRSGGYVVGPGSVVGGHAYTIDRDVAIAPLPDWTTALLTAPRTARGPTRRPAGHTGAAQNEGASDEVR